MLPTLVCDLEDFVPLFLSEGEPHLTLSQHRLKPVMMDDDCIMFY
jgi:hypothetical protein